MGNQLSHHGVPGMKWGVRKSKYDKAMLNSDTKALIKRGRSDDTARNIAKRTQNRMRKKNESHEVAFNTAIRNHTLKKLGTLTVMATVTMAMRDPKIRQKANDGAYALGKKTSQGYESAKKMKLKISKKLDRNLITIIPSNVSRGREAIGLIRQKN